MASTERRAGLVQTYGLSRWPFSEINPSQDSTAVHSVESLDHLALVERGDQAFHRSRRVALACDAFAEDSPRHL